MHLGEFIMKQITCLCLSLMLVIFSNLRAQAPDSLWVSIYNGQGNGFDGTNDCVTDNQGNLFAVGYTQNTQGNNDVIIFKYNTNNGDTIWTRKYNGPAHQNDEAAACITDDSGNLFVVGYSSNGFDDDVLLIKYNSSNGDTIWTRHYNGKAGGNDHGNGCSLDGSGNLYVTGSSENGTNNDYLLIKYNAMTGDTVWTRQFNGQANGNDYAYGCSTDGSGNLFVSGYEFNGTDYNICTVKYNESGDTLWSRRSVNTLDTLRYPVTDCVTDNSGNVFVTGMCGTNRDFQNRYSVITKYNSAGDLKWVKIYDGEATYDQPLGCTLDVTGNLYVSGTSYDGNKDDCFTIKYNSDNGDIMWTKRHIGPYNSSYGLGCTLDNTGALYVTGQQETQDSGFDSFTIKYESTVTSIADINKNKPASFSLYQNYPNPFNPVTQIKFSVKTKNFTTLKVYNALGQVVTTLFNGSALPAQVYEINFDASRYTSGVYYYRLQSGNYIQVKKMIVVK